MGSIGIHTTSDSPTRVLVVGGSYAGLSCALNLHDLFNGKPRSYRQEQVKAEATEPKYPIQITIVDERDGFFHLIGSPLALATEEYARKAWIKYANIPALADDSITVLQGSVTSIDTTTRTASIKPSYQIDHIQQSYDYLVAASGLRRVWPTVPQALSQKSWFLEADNQISTIKNASDRVVIIGGGAVGVEMAAELKLVQPHLKVTLIHSRDTLLSAEPVPAELGDKSRELLELGGVEVILGHRVNDVQEVIAGDIGALLDLTLADGTHILASKVISAVSKPTPTSSYLPVEALNEEHLVKVDERMQFPSSIPNAAYHFAVGDMISWSGIKRCGAAMHEGSIAANNIHQQVIQKLHSIEPKFEELSRFPPSIAMAVGKTAISYSPDHGVRHGAEVMQHFFEGDLALDMVCRMMGLGVSFAAEKEVEATL